MDAQRIPFTPDDEAKIASAATWGSIVAITSIVGGGISLLTTSMVAAEMPAMTKVLIPMLLGTVFVVVINVWLLQACIAFRKVAVTDEADQAYLLAGFRKLRAYFMLQVVMMLGGIILGIFAAVVGAMMF